MPFYVSVLFFSGYIDYLEKLFIPAGFEVLENRVYEKTVENKKEGKVIVCMILMLSLACLLCLLTIFVFFFFLPSCSSSYLKR